MSTNITATARVIDQTRAVPDAERRHRVRLRLLYILAFATNLAIFFYGFDYYKLAAVDRPFSPKHHMLRPSGPIGLYLGFMGVALFLGIFLYVPISLPRSFQEVTNRIAETITQSHANQSPNRV